jgi:thiopurine S-methyltransferase
MRRIKPRPALAFPRSEAQNAKNDPKKGRKMDAKFWLERWQLGQTGFHKAEANPMLLAHFATLDLSSDARIFVPLCGKTRDIAWILSQGHQVVAVELSRVAIDQLFAELSVVPEISVEGDLLRYHAPGLVVFVGDIFALTPDLIGRVDAIYDRAALVALPPEMRILYAAQLKALTATAPQLLITLCDDQSRHAGPPFSVAPSDIAELYGAEYHLELMSDQPVTGGIRAAPAREMVWHLQRLDG